jgi:hypothetical protein
MILNENYKECCKIIDEHLILHKIKKCNVRQLQYTITSIIKKNICVSVKLQLLLISVSFSDTVNKINKFLKIYKLKKSILNSLICFIKIKQQNIHKLIKNDELIKNKINVVMNHDYNANTNTSQIYNNTKQLYNLIISLINNKLILLVFPFEYNEDALTQDIKALQIELKLCFNSLNIFELNDTYNSIITQNMSRLMVYQNDMYETLNLKMKNYRSSLKYNLSNFDIINNYINMGILSIKKKVEYLSYLYKTNELQICNKLSHLRLENYTILKCEHRIKYTVNKLLILQTIIKKNEYDVIKSRQDVLQYNEETIKFESEINKMELNSKKYIVYI